MWRKRLGESKGGKRTAVSFALIEARPPAPTATGHALELELGNGERLRVGNGVDAATLRLVLEMLRG